jgi:hypothetical protein
MTEETTSLKMSISASPTAIKEIGQNFAKGVMHETGTLLLCIAIVIIVTNLFYKIFEVGVDDTDKSTWKRSGLKLFTDYKTGIQYISDGKGSMTVRLGTDGKPMVSK